MRVAVGELRRIEEKLPGGQLLQNLRIRTDSALLHLRLGGLAAHAAEGGCRAHHALLIHELQQRKVVLPADSRIILTEGRGNVYDAGTVGIRYIVVCHHEMCLLVLLLRFLRGARIERLILCADEVCALIGLQHLIGLLPLLCERSEHLVQKRGAEHIGLTVCRLYLGVLQRRMHAECGIAGQGPGCGGPCQEGEIAVLRPEAYDGGALIQLLIALCHLVRGQRGSAAGAVGHYLEALVQKSLLPDLLQRPPLGLNEVIVIGHIGILHVRPEADLVGEILPHALVLPDIFLAQVNEGGNAVLLDLLLAIDADLLLHFQLHRKSVGIPAGLSGHHRSLHGMVSGNHILKRTGFYMADMGLSIGRGRSVIENIGRVTLVLLNGLLEDMSLSPEVFDLLLALDKVHIGINFFKH